MSLRVTASAANLLIPSRSFSTAICSSLKSKRKSDSSLMYDFLSMLSDVAAAASSFLGTGAVSFLSCSRREGAMVRKSTPARDLISPICVAD